MGGNGGMSAALRVGDPRGATGSEPVYSIVMCRRFLRGQWFRPALTVSCASFILLAMVAQRP